MVHSSPATSVKTTIIYPQQDPKENIGNGWEPPSATCLSQGTCLSTGQRMTKGANLKCQSVAGVFLESSMYG